MSNPHTVGDLAKLSKIAPALLEDMVDGMGGFKVTC